MREFVDSLLRSAFEAAKNGGELSSSDLPHFVVESPKDPTHGDLASNLAMILARPERKSPRAIAQLLIDHLPANEDVEGVEIAGPGFLNFRLRPAFWAARLIDVLAAGESFGQVPVAKPQKLQVEFVSANPTGPLTVGHGRNAVIGDTVARLLEARGHDVTREYYFNNAGRQMQVLGRSVQARYLEAIGKPFEFPEDGYQGDYIGAIAETLREAQGEALADADFEPFKSAAEKAIFAEIEETLRRLGIVFDVHFNEDTLYADGSIDRALEDLKKTGKVYEDEGAVWLKLSEMGLPKDKVIVKSSGEPAYRLPDIAYHRNKLDRGFDRVIDVLGADHIDESEEVRAGIAALGYDPRRIHAVIYQFVTLLRAGEQVKMSTRKAEYVTLDELLEEVGSDVVRFLFLTRKSDSHLEFDLDLAKQQSMENPVYYVQYAHARIANIRRKAAEAGLSIDGLEAADVAGLVREEELILIRRIAAFPDVVAEAADGLEPHRITFALLEVAQAFHSYYNQRQNKVVGEDVAVSRARLALVIGVQRVIRNGLGLLGVNAPDQM